MEDYEKKSQKFYNIAFLEVHFNKLLNCNEQDLIFERKITKQSFENAVKDERFSQEFIDKFKNGKDSILVSLD
jgi:hypothetical protein